MPSPTDPLKVAIHFNKPGRLEIPRREDRLFNSPSLATKLETVREHTLCLRAVLFYCQKSYFLLQVYKMSPPNCLIKFLSFPVGPFLATAKLTKTTANSRCHPTPFLHLYHAPLLNQLSHFLSVPLTSFCAQGNGFYWHLSCKHQAGLHSRRQLRHCREWGGEWESRAPGRPSTGAGFHFRTAHQETTGP